MVSTFESNGCKFHYTVEGNGPPAVFIQGVGLHGDGWLPQTQELRSHYQCVTFDHRGMGKSQPAGAEISVPQLAADTLAVMDAAGIAAAHLIGHSMGGAIAIEAALQAPQRVRSLALLCTSARGADATKLTAQMLWLGLRSRLGTRRMRSNAFLEIVMPKAYLAKQDRDTLAASLEPLFGHALWDTPPIVMRQLKALQDFDATNRLRELDGMPTLVVSAAHDILFPPQCGRNLASSIRGARYEEIADAAHGVTIQSAASINALLLEHFRSVH